MRGKLLTLIALLTFTSAITAAQDKQDAVQVLSVTPSGPVPAGVPITFTFELLVTLETWDEARVALGFNSDDAYRTRMLEHASIRRGTQRVRLSAKTTPRNWGSIGRFHAHFIIAPSNPIGPFRPAAPTHYPIEVSAVDAAPSSDSEFKTADVGRRTAILEEIERGGTSLGVDAVIEIVRDAAADSNDDIRLLAMKAVRGRAIASLLIGRRFKPGAPDPTAGRKPAPQSWKDDDERLGQLLWDVLAERLRDDRSSEVRVAALEAMSTFGHFDGNKPFTDEYVTLCLETWRKAGDPDVRAAALKILAHGANDTPEIRSAVVTALGDAAPAVRQAALFFISPRTKGPLVPFSEAESALGLLLQARSPEFRVTAAQALGGYGADARPLLARLDAMALKDPDDEVRRFAAEAAKAIRSAP